MARVKALWSPRWRWLTLTVAWVVVAALGFWGLSIGKPGSSIWNRLYALPDFFSMSISDDTANLDWRIQLARFLGPIAFASTFYAATAAVLRDQVGRFRIRFLRDHVIVAGLGEKGSRLATSLLDAGRKVVVIEPDPTNPERAGVVRRGAIALTGSATDAEVLREAGIGRARELVAFAPDATNAEIVAVARRARTGGGPALRASLHLVDPQLSRLLRTRELSAGTSSVRLDFFNIFQRGARRWLAETDPFARRGTINRPPHVVVLGVGVLGEAVAVAVAQRWAEERGPGDGPVRLTLVDPDASARYRGLRLRHPALVAHTRAEAIDLDPDRPVPDAAESFRSLLAEGSVTAAYVCDDDDTSALSTALFVRHGLGSTPALVTVRTRSAAGLADLLDGTADEGIVGFPLLDRTCSAAALDGGTNEAVARALHDDYLAQVDPAGAPNAVAWDRLDPDVQEANRRTADSVVAALASVGCGLVPLYAWDGAGFAFTDDEVERLAEAEHARWSEERRAAGWTHGEPRDDRAKRHPLLVAWPDLPESAKHQNRQAITALPTVLARAGFEITRLR